MCVSVCVYKHPLVCLCIPTCTHTSVPTGMSSRVADNIQLHIIYVIAGMCTHACTWVQTLSRARPRLRLCRQQRCLVSHRQAGRQQVGREQANNCRQRGRWGRCWWVVRPSLRVARACSAPNLPCRAVIGNKQDMVHCGKA